MKNNIPVFTDGGGEYLDTVEIQTVMNLLKILDNPLDDISLVSVLRSAIFGFSDNELIEIRLLNRDKKFWDSLIDASQILENNKLKEKVNKFLNKINEWRKQSEYLPLTEFIWGIYVETGYYNYVALMPNGTLRQANLKMLFERAKDYEKTSFKGLFNFIRFIEKLKVGNSDLSSAKVIGENEDVVRIMSIHKSKGLEFPVVFLSNSSKKINLEDLKGNILLHKDIGIGSEYINYERKISYSTAAKQAIKVKLKEENISEEMRILYVALTRAREKLIVIAVRKNENKELQKKKELTDIYSVDKKVSPILLKKFTSYLDWIELVKLNMDSIENPIDVFDFKIISSNDIIGNIEEQDEEAFEIDLSSYNNIDIIKEKLAWKYENILSTKIPIKSTISTIKKLENENIDFFELGKNNIGLANIVPEFLKDEKITTTQIGTLTHLVLQKIDFNNVSKENDVIDFINMLIAKKFIREEEAKKINTLKIFNFINSEFAQKIKKSTNIYKEKPFCLEINAKDVFKDAREEKILVQGIIDLYYINEKGNIVLIDYKTDYTEDKTGMELINKYKVQLDLYKKALEESTNKFVEEVYIYSLYLGKEINVI